MIVPVPQLWSRRNEKHYRAEEVTEGAKLELLLVSHKWNCHHHLSELVTSQLRHENQCRQTYRKRRGSDATSFRHIVAVVQNKLRQSEMSVQSLAFIPLLFLVSISLVIGFAK